MARPSTKREVTGAFDLDYDLKRKIAEGCGGWIRGSSNAEGNFAEVWFEDVEYVFRGEGLIEFLYAVKDVQTNHLYEAKDLIDYIEDSAKQPPSKFVRDAIVGRARELKTKAFPGV